MGQFQGAFALHAQAHKKGSSLGRAHFAVHKGGKTGGGHFGREIFPTGQTLQNARHVGHARVLVLAHNGLGKVAQQAQAFGRQHGFGMKLHAYPGTVVVAQGHDFAFGSAGRDRKAGVGGIFIGAHHQGMVTPHAHGIGQPSKQPRAVVHDFRLFAMHDAGAHFYPRAGVQAQQLVAQADAQHGDAGTEAVEKFRAESRIFGAAGAGRDADHGEVWACGQVQQGRVIVAAHFGLVAQGIKGLHQIVGKRIVIIDEQKHDSHPPHAGPGA